MLLLTTTLLLAFQSRAAGRVPGEIDRVCYQDGSCDYLAVRGGRVHFISPALSRDLVMGEYVPVAETLVPKTEAAIRDSKTKSGWRVVTSELLYREEGGGIGLRTRLFSSDGRLRGQFESLTSLVEDYVGSPFGDGAEVAAVSTMEEHSYNVQTQIWLLPLQGEPKQLLESTASLGKFVSNRSGRAPGVWIDRETYDGVNAHTKGFVSEFWVWNSKNASLKLDPQGTK